MAEGGSAVELPARNTRRSVKEMSGNREMFVKYVKMLVELRET